MSILSRVRRAAHCLFHDEPLHSAIRAKGSVEVILRYSDLYPNSKLHGEVAKYYGLGSNLVVLRGRNMSAGLWAGGSFGGTVVGVDGLNELGGPSNGWVIRGMAVGEGDEPETDADESLESPLGATIPAPDIWYHAIDQIDYQAYSNPGVTRVIFGRTFAPTEPTAVTANIREFGLYTAAPLTFGVATTPVGPSGGPYMVARKTHGLITKSANFTMQLLWTIEF